MAEPITWAEVRVGDVLQLVGVPWRVLSISPRGAIKLQSRNGTERFGTPDSTHKVQVIERGPDPDPDAVAVAALTEAMVAHYRPAVAALRLAGLKPEPVCGFWDGVMETHCGAAEVRLYTVGHRCGVHAPGKLRAARGRKPCRKCGQPVPDDATRPEHCLACGSVLAAR